MVGRAGEAVSGLQHPCDGGAEVRAVGVEHGRVVEAGVPARGRPGALALPCVEADVVMVAAGAHEGGAPAALRHLEAEEAVEGNGAVEIGDAQVGVAYDGMCHAAKIVHPIPGG